MGVRRRPVGEGARRACRERAGGFELSNEMVESAGVERPAKEVRLVAG
jgi:hypothetical protein